MRTNAHIYKIKTIKTVKKTVKANHKYNIRQYYLIVSLVFYVAVVQ